jgi:uncharacterized membrane protein
LKSRQIFTDANRKQIREAIARAEAVTSGEIRVFVDERCNGSELDHAAAVFEKLGMHKTKERNGVLFYVSAADRRFAVIGDAGIHARVHDGFWESVRDEMMDEMKTGNLIGGLVRGIGKAGRALAEYFPRRKDDSDELPNEIAFGG